MALAQTNKLIPLLIPAAVIALTVLGMVVAAILGKRRESRRRAALASVASELCMAFTPEDDALLGQFGGGYAFFPYGGAPRAVSVMRGAIDGVPLVLFDHHVTVGIGKGRNTLRQTAAAFDLAPEPLPVFAAQGWRQNWLTRLLDPSADPPIDFPDDPEFTRGFRVVGADDDAVRQLFGPDARSFLKPRTDWMFRSDGRWLLMCRIGKRVRSGDYRAFVGEVAEGMQAITGARV